MYGTKTNYDYSKLRGRIVEKFGSLGRFGDCINRDGFYVSRLLNEKANFTQKIIDEWVEALDIEPEKIGTYFFTHRVDK